MRKHFALLLLSCFFWMTLPAHAIIDFYLDLDGVPGESTAVGHEDEIVIESFQMGVSRPEGAQPAFTDLNFSKALDKASPLLMLKCAQGAIIPNAVLTCRTGTSGGKPVAFYVIRLTNVKVSQVSVAGAAGGGTKPGENFSLNYETIEWEYTPVNNTGGTGQLVKAKWSLKTGQGS